MVFFPFSYKNVQVIILDKFTSSMNCSLASLDQVWIAQQIPNLQMYKTFHVFNDVNKKQHSQVN